MKEKDKDSSLTDKNKTDKKDISNSLENSTTNAPLSRKQTPQGRTDNEQDRERKQK
jgi:hypothetical protein